MNPHHTPAPPNRSSAVSDYLPKRFDAAEMLKDVDLMESLYPLMVRFSQLAQKLADTHAIVASEAYAAALAVYDAAKDAEGAHPPRPGQRDCRCAGRELKSLEIRPHLG